MAAHPLALGEDVAFPGALEVSFGRAGFQTEHGIQRMELEETAVGFTRRPTRTAPALFTKISKTVGSSIIERIQLGNVLRQAARPGKACREACSWPCNSDRISPVGLHLSYLDSCIGYRSLSVRLGGKFFRLDFTFLLTIPTMDVF